MQTDVYITAGLNQKMTNKTFSISVLLPTRGRTVALESSVFSLLNLATSPEKIQLVFGFDNDDSVGLNYFLEKIQPKLEELNANYTALSFDSMGYEGLNTYYNALATKASADWLFVWNDDCIMNTKGWDDEIRRYNGEFRVLKVHTHNEHPYSIFPIVPSAWVDITGQLSRHQMIDAEISQIGYMLDVIQIVDIDVTHDRTDLTGNQSNEPTKPRTRFEGNPESPLDFHNSTYVQNRMNDTERLSILLKTMNIDTTFWENIKTLKQDPWEKLKQNDINSHMYHFNLSAES
jgi:hypothetical protein